MKPADPAAVQREPAPSASDRPTLLASPTSPYPRTSPSFKLLVAALVALFVCIGFLGSVDGGDEAQLIGSATVVDAQSSDMDHESLGLRELLPAEATRHESDRHKSAPPVRIVSRVPTPPDRPPSRA